MYYAKGMKGLGACSTWDWIAHPIDCGSTGSVQQAGVAASTPAAVTAYQAGSGVAVDPSTGLVVDSGASPLNVGIPQKTLVAQANAMPVADTLFSQLVASGQSDAVAALQAAQAPAAYQYTASGAPGVPWAPSAPSSVDSILDKLMAKKNADTVASATASAGQPLTQDQHATVAQYLALGLAPISAVIAAHLSAKQQAAVAKIPKSKFVQPASTTNWSAIGGVGILLAAGLVVYIAMKGK